MAAKVAGGVSKPTAIRTPPKNWVAESISEQKKVNKQTLGHEGSASV